MQDDSRPDRLRRRDLSGAERDRGSAARETHVRRRQRHEGGQLQRRDDREGRVDRRGGADCGEDDRDRRDLDGRRGDGERHEPPRFAADADDESNRQQRHGRELERQERGDNEARKRRDSRRLDGAEAADHRPDAHRGYGLEEKSGAGDIAEMGGGERVEERADAVASARVRMAELPSGQSDRVPPDEAAARSGGGEEHSGDSEQACVGFPRRRSCGR